MRIAHELAEAEAGICYSRMGVSTQAYGALCQWAIQVINVATGHLDKPGGNLFTHRRWIRWSIPTPAVLATLPPVGGACPSSITAPCATMVDEIRTEEGQIRLMFTEAGNPVLSTPNGRA